MKIYTKTGDFGETSLYGGKRVSKSSLQIEAYGNIDELNSFLGLALSDISQVDIRHFLKAIQTDLFTIAAYLSGYQEKKLDLEFRVAEIEKVIDGIEKQLPKQNHFILPGGGKLGASLQVARAVARRVERSVIRFFKEDTAHNIPVNLQQKVIKYLNRVSDFLFVLSRFANKEDKIDEETFSI